ncbi:MAG: helix-turn-helix transcriptional regulator, partial [Mycobacterium sp.]
AVQAAEFARGHGQPAREVMCLQAAAQLGDTAVAERLAELAGLVEGPRAAVAARYARAVADDDTAGLKAASRDFEALGDMLASADAAAQAATSYRHAGLRGSALSASARARELAQTCGGATSPALAGAQVTLPLTEREREIAVLVAQGLSNRDIAAATSLSVRTVEGHLYRATVKAGVATRAELSSVIKQFSQAAATVPPS